MNRKERVEFFIRRNKELGCTDKLYFDPKNRELIQRLSTLSDLPNILKEILLAVQTYASFEIFDGKLTLQCYSASRRSSYDLWRHVLGLGYNYSLLDVIASIAEIKKFLYSNVCTDVGRRVFLPTTGYGFCPEICHRDVEDEYGLIWSEWAGISGPAGLKPTTHLIFDPNDELWCADMQNEFLESSTDSNEDFDPYSD